MANIAYKYRTTGAVCKDFWVLSKNLESYAC